LIQTNDNQLLLILDNEKDANKAESKSTNDSPSKQAQQRVKKQPIQNQNDQQLKGSSKKTICKRVFSMFSFYFRKLNSQFFV